MRRVGAVDLDQLSANPAVSDQGYTRLFSKADGRSFVETPGGLVTLSGSSLPELEPVRVATTANVSMSGLQTVDGIALAAGDRVLVRYQAAGATNGVYIAGTGVWTRASDANTATKLARGTKVTVLAGNNFRYKTLTQIAPVTTLDVDVVDWRVLSFIDTNSWFLFPAPQGVGHLYWNTDAKAIAGWDGGRWQDLNGSYIATSTTRPPAPAPGNVLYETDTGKTYVWDGSTWQPIGGASGGGTGGPAYYEELILATRASTNSNAGITIPNFSIVFTSLGPADMFEVILNFDAEVPWQSWATGGPRIDGASLAGNDMVLYAGGGGSGQAHRSVQTKTWKATGLAAGNHTLTAFIGNVTGTTATTSAHAGSSMTIKRITGSGSGGNLGVGHLSMWPGATAPTGWLLCTGGTFSSVAFPELAAIVGDTYGTHSGTTYYLPDFRGRSPIGATPSPPPGLVFAYALGQKAGAEQHTLTAAELPPHIHNIRTFIQSQIIAHPHNRTDGVAAGSGNSDSEFAFPTRTETTAAAAHNNLHPILAINYIIKATTADKSSNGSSGTVPALAAGTWTNIVHNLGTETVGVWVKETTSKEKVDVDWKVVDTNTIALRSHSAVAAGFLTVVVKA